MEVEEGVEVVGQVDEEVEVSREVSASREASGLMKPSDVGASPGEGADLSGELAEGVAGEMSDVNLSVDPSTVPPAPRRSSGRARKTKNIVEDPQPAVKRKPAKRKVDLSSDPTASAPKKRKTPKKSLQPSQPAIAAIGESAIAAIGAIGEPAIAAIAAIGEPAIGAIGAIGEPARGRKPKPPYVAADVPPIDGLPYEYEPIETPAPKVRKVKRKPAKDTVLEIALDPSTSEDVVLDSVAADALACENRDSVDSIILAASPAIVKKLNQPSLRQFFAPSLAPSLRSPDADPIIASGPTPQFSVPEPSLSAYRLEWKRVRFQRPRRRNFFGKLGSLRPSEIGSSRKANVYAGDNPELRKRLARLRPVFISIHDRERPPVKLIVTHSSAIVTGRRPLGMDQVIDYEKDSDEEWIEEHEGEDVEAEGDEEENEDDATSVDSFLVSDGHFSGDEVEEDEAIVARRRREPTSNKSTLQLICYGPADFADPEFQPQLVWVKELLDEAVIVVSDETCYFNYDPPERIAKVEKPVVNWALVKPELARFIHGKVAKSDSLISEFRPLHPTVSKKGLETAIRGIAAWTKPSLDSRTAWCVKPELFAELGLTEEHMQNLITERRVEIIKPEKPAKVNKTKQPAVSCPILHTALLSEDRAVIHD